MLHLGESSFIHSTLSGSVFIMAMLQQIYVSYECDTYNFSSQQQVNLQCVRVLSLFLLWEMHVKRLASQQVGTKWVCDFLLLLFLDGQPTNC